MEIETSVLRQLAFKNPHMKILELIEGTAALTHFEIGSITLIHLLPICIRNEFGYLSPKLYSVDQEYSYNGNFEGLKHHLHEYFGDYEAHNGVLLNVIEENGKLNYYLFFTVDDNPDFNVDLEDFDGLRNLIEGYYVLGHNQLDWVCTMLRVGSLVFDYELKNALSKVGDLDEKM